jgi:hypothetical protein
MPGVFLLAPGPVFIDPDQQTVHNNATVTTSGSSIYSGFGVREIVLVINITAAPTGTLPTITYSMQEVDPGNLTTTVGTSVTGAALTGVGTQILSLPLTLTGAVKVSWTVTGTLPSFTGVYATVVTKITTVASGLDATGTEHPLLVDPSGRSAVIEPPDQEAGAGFSLIVDPSTGNQSANYTNNTGPTNATLSNTAASYTTIGGLFQFVAPAGAETDYALFAYQVPVGYTLYVDSVRIGSFVTGTKSSTSETILQWALAANSSGVSLATVGPHPPIFFPAGMQEAPKSASRGTPFDPSPVYYKPRTPVAVSPTRYFHVVLRVPVGNPTITQTIRGYVNVEGYFQAS